MEGIHEGRHGAGRIHADGMAGPRGRPRAEDGEEPGFEPPREPVGTRLVLLAQKHEGGHEEKEGMAHEPDRAELSLTEKPQPGRRLEDGGGASRHHRDLIPEPRQSREKDENGESERDAPKPVVPGAHGGLIAATREETQREDPDECEPGPQMDDAEGDAECAHFWMPLSVVAGFTVKSKLDSTMCPSTESTR